MLRVVGNTCGWLAQCSKICEGNSTNRAAYRSRETGVALAGEQPMQGMAELIETG